MNSKKSEGKLDIKAKQSFANYNEMYKVVDFLNKNLKDHNVIFGLTKDSNERMSITIYEV